MFILTIENDVIICLSETLDYQNNGNPLVNNGKTAFDRSLIKGMYFVNNKDIPEDVSPNKYCYNEEDRFYKNPNYKKEYSQEERISALEDAVNMLLGF